jgi:hypothetical protein
LHQLSEIRRRLLLSRAFAVKGTIKADIELPPLSAISDIFKRPEHGLVPAPARLPDGRSQESFPMAQTASGESTNR